MEEQKNEPPRKVTVKLTGTFYAVPGRTAEGQEAVIVTIPADQLQAFDWDQSGLISLTTPKDLHD